MVPHDADEDDLVLEEVERRVEPRGSFPGMTATILEGAYAGRVFEVIEASRKGLFLKLDSPDTVPLGTRFVIQVTYQSQVFRCNLEIARKEISPRRGVAGRISALDESSRQTLEEILATAEAAVDH